MRKSEIHMHSTFSDGEFSPAKLVDIAKKNNVSILSLTDHDTFDGVNEFVDAANAAGIIGFPGIEMTTRYGDFNIHLLAYFESPDGLSDTLKNRVRSMTAAREDRMLKLVARINEVVPRRHRGSILFENVKKAAEGVLARPHLAREMVRLGIVNSTGQAFEKYLVQYNVERDNLDVQEALKMIRESNGIPVLAHPGERTYSLYNPAKGRDYADIPMQLEELKGWGLLGLECIYPYHEKVGTVDYYCGLARDLGLIITGSRDFHGFTTYQNPRILGSTKMDDQFFDQFQELWDKHSACKSEV